MRLFLAVLLLCLFSFAALPALAQVEAKAVALQNGCKPTKLDVLSQTVGAVGEITYKADCTKATTGGNAGPLELRIKCRKKQCYVVH